MWSVGRWIGLGDGRNNYIFRILLKRWCTFAAISQLQGIWDGMEGIKGFNMGLKSFRFVTRGELDGEGQ